MTGKKLTASQTRLVLFVLLSVVLHTVMFVKSKDISVSISTRMLQTAGISAQLSAPGNAGSKKMSSQARGYPDSGSSKTAEEEKQINKHETSTSGINPDAATAVVYAYLRGQLENRFYYPPLAKRQGWQGKVLLDFTISEEGQLNDIRVKQSSGYEILDRAAMDALTGVVITGIREELILAAVRPGRLSLPVAYRLVN